MKLTLPPVRMACPCGIEIDVPVACELGWDGQRQRLHFAPDYSDLWAHAWTHDESVNFDFDGGAS